MSTLNSRNALMVSELFCEIIDFFHPEMDPTARPTLFALARTCRAFSEPSLDRLWRTLRSLKPLIRCYTTIDAFENKGQIPPTTSQLAIIDRYSHRVRDLIISESIGVRFLRCMSTRPSLLFPNLMVLQWGIPQPPCIPIISIQHLLSPTLVSITADLSEEDGETLLSFLDNFPLLCRNLRSIVFRFYPGVRSEMTIQALSRALCNQNILENVVLQAPIDMIALKHLSMLPSLKFLSVALPESSTPEHGSLLSIDLPFCSVEKLRFTVWDLDLVSSFLRPRDQKFHAFHLYHRGRQTSDTLLSFLAALTSRSHAAPLRDLTLSFEDFSHPIPADQMPREATRYRLSYKTLRPLATLRSLRELVIVWSEQVSLDDNELASLAGNWPLLRTLIVYCGRGGYPPFSTKYVTLQGLLSLVNTCPELCTVSLPLDARHIPVAKETDVCETYFQCLTVSESPIDEAVPVAEFLFKYLPSLTTVDARFLRPPGTDDTQIMKYERTWGLVEMHLDELHYMEAKSMSSDDDDSSIDDDD